MKLSEKGRGAFGGSRLEETLLLLTDIDYYRSDAEEDNVDLGLGEEARSQKINQIWW